MNRKKCESESPHSSLIFILFIHILYLYIATFTFGCAHNFHLESSYTTSTPNYSKHNPIQSHTPAPTIIHNHYNNHTGITSLLNHRRHHLQSLYFYYHYYSTQSHQPPTHHEISNCNCNANDYPVICP